MGLTILKWHHWRLVTSYKMPPIFTQFVEKKSFLHRKSRDSTHAMFDRTVHFVLRFVSLSQVFNQKRLTSDLDSKGTGCDIAGFISSVNRNVM